MERTRELATLNTIAGVVSGTLDMKEIMGAALEKAMEAMRMDIGTAYSLQPGDTPDEDKLLLLAAAVAYRPSSLSTSSAAACAEPGFRWRQRHTSRWSGW